MAYGLFLHDLADPVKSALGVQRGYNGCQFIQAASASTSVIFPPETLTNPTVYRCATEAAARRHDKSGRSRIAEFVAKVKTTVLVARIERFMRG